MQWPGHALDYLPSREIGESLQPLNSIAKTPDTARTSTSGVGSFDSARSVSHPQQISEPYTPLSSSSTPPLLLSRSGTQRNSAAQSMSTSPENKSYMASYGQAPSGASSFSASSFSRPFTLSQSPPRLQRASRHLSNEDLPLSTSVSSGVSNVTWGPTTYHQGSHGAHGSSATMRRSFLAHEVVDTYTDGSSTEEDDEPVTPSSLAIKVNLKNQLQFDDDSVGQVPFLSPAKVGRYEAYRNAYADLLDSWCLWTARHEVLKFNRDGRKDLECNVQDSEPLSTAIHPRPQETFDDSISQTTMTLDKMDTRGNDNVAKTLPDITINLTIARVCTKCSRILPKMERQGRCPNCNGGMKIVPCSVCSEPIKSLHRACVACGCIAHVNCLDAISQSARLGLEDKGANLPTPGQGAECGCIYQNTMSC